MMVLVNKRVSAYRIDARRINFIQNGMLVQGCFEDIARPDEVLMDLGHPIFILPRIPGIDPEDPLASV